MLKTFVLMMATMFAVFSLPAVADDGDRFVSSYHSVPVGDVSQPALAIADCDRCMYAGLGDKQPLIAMNRPKNDGTIGGGTSNAWTGYFEVGWRS